jgi:anthranilate synthase/aminodeoxychorismate synthase-like glutamine amidotransferase
MIVFIDNYDSFTYNLVDLFARHERVKVFRNDLASMAEILALKPKGVVISPGPGRPEDSGISIAFVQKYHQEIPIFGVCLGQQIIGQVLGGSVVRAEKPMHGKTSRIHHGGKSVFKGLPNPLEIMRYHSLLLEKESLPRGLEITAETESGEIMAIAHKQFSLTAVQFHPESILSQAGEDIVKNWLAMLGKV